MEPQKRVKQLLNPHVLLPIIAALIALILIVLICIFASEANSVQNEYALARDSVGEDLYTSLYMFARSYDGVTLAGADVQGSILPTMRRLLHRRHRAGRRHRQRLRPALPACWTARRATPSRRPLRPSTTPLPRATPRAMPSAA